MITPQFVGQHYRDTSTGDIWVANSLTPGDWSLLVQDMQVAWTPANLKLGEEIGFFSSAGLAGITAITFDGATNAEQLFINNATDLVSFSLPNMTSFNTLQLGTNVKLTTILLPLVANCDSITIQNNPLITSLDFASLVSTNSLGDFNDLTISGNIALTSINLPIYVPDNTLGINFSGNALNAASVNQLLARCVANAAFVSGAIDLTGGTNSPPTSKAPGSDYAILIARGVTVNTN